MNILLLSTGSVSAYLSHKLAYQLKGDGHEVKHYMTKAAGQMMALSNGSNSKNVENQTFHTGHFSNYISIEREAFDWHDKSNNPVLHIDIVNWADVCVVCPADFNILGKMANGIADDVVSSILAAWLGSGKKLYICEAMNTMMYKNQARQRNRDILENIENVYFIEPTVKRLACGDFGIGALADINTIANIVEGHRWAQPITLGDLDHEGHRWVQPITFLQEYFNRRLPEYNEPGAFGAVRKFDIHEGVDIYCVKHAKVYAMEDGEVVASYHYTGNAAKCDWWNDTWCIKIKGKSGVITYGELEMPEYNRKLPSVGTFVKAGDLIGVVGQVLKDGKKRNDIRNHNVCMLHVELRTESCHIDGWKLDEDRDKRLLDPTPYLKLIC
jgi:murein DD-endopeptidase MepM/ murein hydrolase activator NlpD